LVFVFDETTPIFLASQTFCWSTKGLLYSSMDAFGMAAHDVSRVPKPTKPGGIERSTKIVVVTEGQMLVFEDLAFEWSTFGNTTNQPASKSDC
jgi:hypothetical protein